MKVGLNIQYSADADREGETDEDEQRTLRAIEGAVDEFVSIVRRNCEAEGVSVHIER